MDLDTVIDRTNVTSLKFDGSTMQSIFGERDLWPSWVADMDFMAAPEIIDALSERLKHGVLGYEADSGDLPNAVANWYQTRYQWTFDPKHIITTPRTLNSLTTLVNLFSKEGDGVIIQSPVFYDFKLILRANNRRLVKNALHFEQGRYQMDFANLELLAAKPDTSLLILCNPHNPIGRVWSRADLGQLAETCIRHKVFIIADEIHGDITYQQRYTPLASVSVEAAQNCATCISPIKSFNLAGVANSMIVIANEAKRKTCADWYSRQQLNKNFIFNNAAMLAAYTRGEPWLEQVTDYLQGNINLLRDYLVQKIPQIKLVEPEGSYLLWLDFRSLSLDIKQLETFLIREAKMATNPGHWFGREGVGFVRINIACPRNVLISALSQLENAINKLS
ncbi:MAG: putative C-S lyase [Gammaproteobacteria bacterium]|nr:putative C-S lyase [Gammaproteobacteria bacterium]